MSGLSLDLYRDLNREDNFVTATDQGRSDAQAAGYTYVRKEANLFPSSEPGVMPLNLYWNAQRGDNFTAATPEADRDAIAAGYQKVRVEGYVKTQPSYNTVPLYLYYNPAREDNFLTGTAQGQADAFAAGYRFVRVEGYGAAPSGNPVRPDYNNPTPYGTFTNPRTEICNNATIVVERAATGIFHGIDAANRVTLSCSGTFIFGSTLVIENLLCTDADITVVTSSTVDIKNFIASGRVSVNVSKSSTLRIRSGRINMIAGVIDEASTGVCRAFTQSNQVTAARASTWDAG